MNDKLGEAFDELFGVPSWNVKQGHGSFLTFEFGQPSLEIDEVRYHEARPQFPATRSRLVTPRGEWHLWIYCCSWTIRQERTGLAHCESSSEVIDTACRVLAGQALTAVERAPLTRKVEFIFDLGGILETRGDGYTEADVSWMLFRPDQRVFSYRHDGYYCLGSVKSNADEWQLLPNANLPD